MYCEYPEVMLRSCCAHVVLMPNAYFLGHYYTYYTCYTFYNICIARLYSSRQIRALR